MSASPVAGTAVGAITTSRNCMHAWTAQHPSKQGEAAGPGKRASHMHACASWPCPALVLPLGRGPGERGGRRAHMCKHASRPHSYIARRPPPPLTKRCAEPPPPVTYEDGGDGGSGSESEPAGSLDTMGADSACMHSCMQGGHGQKPSRPRPSGCGQSSSAVGVHLMAGWLARLGEASPFLSYVASDPPTESSRQREPQRSPRPELAGRPGGRHSRGRHSRGPPLHGM